VWPMGRRTLAAGVAALWLALPAAASVSYSRIVTPTTVAGIGLGLRPAAYQRAFNERPTRIALPAKRAKLIFARSELAVTLGARGSAIAIETAAREYGTQGGAHPCGPLKVLAREFGRKLVDVREPTTGTLVAYRVGRLTFSVAMDRIGSIILSSSPVSAAAAANSPHCDGGEEGK
jgi:hypothetical protein